MWKYNDGDIAESKHWKEYMKVYEKIFEKSEIALEIIPSDDKWFRDYLIALTLVERLERLQMKYPKLK